MPKFSFGGGGGSVAGVESFEGRQGAVTIQSGDATSSEITNASGVIGATVTDALNKLATDMAGLAAGISDWQASVKSVTNTPPGGPTSGDRYLIGASPTGAWSSNAKNIAEWNGSAWVYTAPAAGMATIADDTVHIWAYRASDTTWVDLGASGAVSSVFGRTGAVAQQAGDYTAQQITNTPAGDIAGTNVQTAINEIDTKKVAGPASATDNAIARYDGATGKVLQSSAVTIADTTGNMAGVGTINGKTLPAANFASSDTTMTAGDGLVGGGDLSSNRTLSVGAGAGITVDADAVRLSDIAEATVLGRAAGGGTGVPNALSAAQARTLLNVPEVTRQIATQHSLAGGGDLTADRTLSLVNDAASPGVGQYYGTDATGAKGYFPLPAGSGGAGSASFGDSGTLSFSKTATGLESVVTGGIAVDAGTWDADATKVTFQYEGSILNSSGSNKTASFQLKLGTTIINIDGAATKTTATIGSRSTARGTSVTLELWRLSSTTMGGAITVDIDGVALTQGVLTTATGLDFGAPIIVDLLVNFSATPVTIAFSLWEWSRVGTTEGTGSQIRMASSILALKAIGTASMPSGTPALLQGGATAVDGQEGTLFYSPTSLATPDDIYVIKPDDVTLPAPGRWIRAKQTIVPTVAALRTMVGVNTGELVVVRDYAAPGDGGGGTFYWDSADAAVHLVNVGVGAGGSGYAVGDRLLLSGGTRYDGTETANSDVFVTAVSSGAVTAVVLFRDCRYSAPPSSPAATTNLRGSGSGCTISFSTEPYDDVGLTVAPTGVTVGKWKRRDINHLNVLWFGCNKTLDATVHEQFQKIFNLGSYTKIPVYIPAGQYWITSPLYLVRDTTILGAGKTQTMIYASSTRALTIDGQKYGSGGYAFNNVLRDFQIMMAGSGADCAIRHHWAYTTEVTRIWVQPAAGGLIYTNAVDIGMGANSSWNYCIFYGAGWNSGGSAWYDCAAIKLNTGCENVIFINPDCEHWKTCVDYDGGDAVIQDMYAEAFETCYYLHNGSPAPNNSRLLIRGGKPLPTGVYAAPGDHVFRFEGCDNIVIEGVAHHTGDIPAAETMVWSGTNTRVVFRDVNPDFISAEATRHFDCELPATTRRLRGHIAASTTITGGNWLVDVGNYWLNSSPAAGGYMGWVCTTAGAYADVFADNTQYGYGDVRRNAGNEVYVCTKGGTTGTSHPTGTGSAITDGTTTWRYERVTGSPVVKGFGAIQA